MIFLLIFPFYKVESFSALTLVTEWLKALSHCSHIRFSAEMQSLYLEIYDNYRS